MKDAVARRTAETAVIEADKAREVAAAAREKVEQVARQFDEWIPTFEKAATKTISDQLKEHVAPLAVQLREISSTLATLQNATVQKKDIDELRQRVLKTEQTLKRFSAALAS